MVVDLACLLGRQISRGLASGVAGSCYCDGLAKTWPEEFRPGASRCTIGYWR